MLQQANELLGIDLLSGRQAVKLSISLAHVLTLEVQSLTQNVRTTASMCLAQRHSVAGQVMWRWVAHKLQVAATFSSRLGIGLTCLLLNMVQGEKRMKQRRFDAAVSILDDAYRLLNGLADSDDTEHAKAAVASMQSRVCTDTVSDLLVYDPDKFCRASWPRWKRCMQSCRKLTRAPSAVGRLSSCLRKQTSMPGSRDRHSTASRSACSTRHMCRAM